MILVVNAGSSSIKVALFNEALEREMAAEVAGIGGRACLDVAGTETPVTADDHGAALDHLLEALGRRGATPGTLRAAAHRIVHGGATLTAPARLSEDVLARIDACTPLAPLHNPHNLAAIRALAARAPDLPQFGSFDTAFHASCPEVATTYALPEAERAKGIRRYGFHGLSYAGLVEWFGADLPRRLLAFHLGGGASLCAIQNGRSVASSMGYSPLDGLVMGTRTGEIDGMAVLRLAADHGLEGAAHLLNHDSGLRALGGTSDMAALLASDEPRARFAVDHYCYWAARQAGSAVVAMGGLDAIAFTGGIGENAAPVRDAIRERLSFLGAVPVHVVPSDEEGQIARDALRLLG